MQEPPFAHKAGLIVVVVALVAAVGLLVPPIPQDPAYHNFADQRRILGIPNFWNVVSNLPFLAVGALGTLITLRRHFPGGLTRLKSAYLIFFVGIGLVAAGSSYYHLAPSNQTLVWDRLPMTLGFMGFFAAIVGENVSLRAGVRLLWPLVAVGLLSVAYWHFSELRGEGDLRPYALVQFLPLLLTPVILGLFPSPWRTNLWIWTALGAYVLSKMAELADAPLFDILGFISGHSLKHFLAAAGGLAVLAALCYRTRRAGRCRHGVC